MNAEEIRNEIAKAARFKPEALRDWSIVLGPPSESLLTSNIVVLAGGGLVAIDQATRTAYVLAG